MARDDTSASARPGVRPVPTTHRSLARLAFPRRRWLHVLLIPSAISVAALLLSTHLFRLWAWAINLGIQAFELNGVVRPLPLRVVQWDAPSVVLADIPAAAPSIEQLAAGGLIAALLLILSYVISPDRAPVRYLLRALSLCHASSVAFFGLLGGRLPYTLGDHVATGLTLAWMFMLLVPWLHAASYHIFPFGAVRKLALSLLTLGYFVVFAPVQYLFHLCAVQTYSLLQLPVLYLVGGVLLDVVAFISLYAWGMSWEAVEDAPREAT